LASVVLRFWWRGSLPAPEIAAREDPADEAASIASLSRFHKPASAARSTRGESSTLTSKQETLSNIQTGSSCERITPSTLHRKLAARPLSIF